MKRQLLEEAHKYCVDNDKSTEFIIEYMQNFADASLDEVLDYLENKTTISFE